MNVSSGQWLKVGRISGVHGVRGWVKVYSYTLPTQQIVSYQPWYLERGGEKKQYQILDSKLNGKAVIASLANIENRDQAQELIDCDIVVEAEQLPNLESGEFYWHQLEGLRVISQFEGQEFDLGIVDRLLETGSNDVLVVQGNDQSIDRKERLLPYLKGSTVLEVDINQQQMFVDWDPEF